MLDYPRWKYILVAVVLVLASIIALPNIFPDDAALQVARKDRADVDVAGQQEIEAFLRSKGVQFDKSFIDAGRVMVRFGAVPEQLKARDVVNEGLKDRYVTAMSFASRAPAWTRWLHLRPMPLGLDLRGGLYLLYQVDVNGAVAQTLENYEQDFRRVLRVNNIPFTDVTSLTAGSDIPNGLRISMPAGADTAAARAALSKEITELTFRDAIVANGTAIDMVMSDAQVRERKTFAIQQNITTLRNRVNELGVSEPIVQQQGLDRITVQLPGVQNSAEVKDILGKVATLEFRLADPRLAEAMQRKRAPVGTKLYKDKEGRDVLLKRDIIVTGDQLTNANSSVGQNGAQVDVTLSARGGEEMLKTTKANLGKPMGVVLIEQRREISEVNGQKIERTIKEERVINVATIQGVFSSRFQITGQTSAEARELALLLRGGALAAPIFIAQEKVIGPQLGKENIEKGVTALIVGMLALFTFMVIYYQLFGLIANAVLLANVIVLAALLSMLGTALSLPGIAGIILTVGMAVDANVLIYERIREELRNGVSPQAAIKAGFEKAFSAIADSNITTAIAGIVLWIFGTGAIRGFAVVLTLGIMTSMFTSLMGSRALVTLIFGGAKKRTTLPIG
jgi:preprotein translocase subunit SecD